MDRIKIKRKAAHRLGGRREAGIVGVVASGNCEILFERVAGTDTVEVEIVTATEGFRELWRLVLGDFLDDVSVGGMRISINDGGANPDVVRLRLAQGVALMEAKA